MRGLAAKMFRACAFTFRKPTTFRKMRTRMKLSQKEFAARFGFSLDSIQNWEQGRRIPDGPARTLLAVVAREPKAVERALRAAS